MNHKRPYRSDTPTPTYEHETTISATGKNYHVTRGQEVTLESAINHPAGRYRFEYTEPDKTGTVLVFYGPIRRTNQKYRRVWPAQQQQLIRTVHVKTG